MRSYERILAAVAATPWAIEPNKGRELAAMLSRRVNGERPRPNPNSSPRRPPAPLRRSRKSKARPGGVA
jgi:hypothetical protein